MDYTAHRIEAGKRATAGRHRVTGWRKTPGCPCGSCGASVEYTGECADCGCVVRLVADRSRGVLVLVGAPPKVGCES